MTKPSYPQDEQSRLETLRSLNILDTLPEERFDRLTRMAKRMFGVPISLVSLVDENRQWFKSTVGLDASETPRDISFCGHAVLGDDVFVVPNAIEDKRFTDNPLVTGNPNIRFYAGCPLSVDGQKLGTLCIIDRKPRTFDKEDMEALADLAAMVEDELAAVQLATNDELTDISNRRGFVNNAEHALKLAIRHKTISTLVFLDIDKLKAINDDFGHAEGDRALVVFADKMKNTIRASDLFARFGGDEFVVMLANTAKPQAEQLMARFSRSLKQYNREAQHGYEIAFSHGIVEIKPEKHPLLDDLLAEGDSLMYEAKKAEKTSST